MPQVLDTEKRLNILFDHLNNEDLPKDTVSDMEMLAQALQTKDYEAAQGILVDIMRDKMDQGQNWMVSIIRSQGRSRRTYDVLTTV